MLANIITKLKRSNNTKKISIGGLGLELTKFELRQREIVTQDSEEFVVIVVRDEETEVVHCSVVICDGRCFLSDQARQRYPRRGRG
jgi:hypothetical protein